MTCCYPELALQEAGTFAIAARATLPRFHTSYLFGAGKELASLAVRYLFLDESGNLDFTPKGSRFLTLASVTLDDCQVGNDLLDLRRTLARQGFDFFEQFHASEDRQVIRDRVFAAIRDHHLRIDVTLLEKSHADAHLKSDPDRFYQLGIYLHLQHVVPAVMAPGDELLVVCAALGTKRQMEAHLKHLRYVTREISPEENVTAAHWRSASEPCLQVADYCCWAVHRKWERGDCRSYDLISDHIGIEFELFGSGDKGEQ